MAEMGGRRGRRALAADQHLHYDAPHAEGGRAVDAIRASPCRCSLCMAVLLFACARVCVLSVRLLIGPRLRRLRSAESRMAAAAAAAAHATSGQQRGGRRAAKEQWSRTDQPRLRLHTAVHECRAVSRGVAGCSIALSRPLNRLSDRSAAAAARAKVGGAVQPFRDSKWHDQPYNCRHEHTTCLIRIESILSGRDSRVRFATRIRVPTNSAD